MYRGFKPVHEEVGNITEPLSHKNSQPKRRQETAPFQLCLPWMDGRMERVGERELS